MIEQIRSRGETLDVVIQNEEQAWKWLKLALEDNLPASDGPYILKFEGWPTLDLKFNGKDFDQSVPTRLMPALLDAQKEIHRVYAMTRYGDENLRRLTAEDREKLELVVRVEDGSSEFETNLEHVLTEAFMRGVERMDSIHLLILFLGLAVTWGSVVAWKAWLRSQEARKETESRVDISKLEAEKLHVLADAMNRSSELRELSAGVDAFRNTSLHKLKPADTFSIPKTDLVVGGEHAATVTTAPRSQSVDDRLKGTFAIQGVDVSAAQGYRVKVRAIADGTVFTVSIPDDVFTRDQLDIIKEAEWEKRLVYMEIQVKLLRGQISAASLDSVERIAEPARVKELETQTTRG